MVQGVNLNNVKEINSGSLLNSNASIQLIFAQLQMELSAVNKEAAMDKINAIRDSQTDSKTYTDAINALRTMSDYDVEKYGELPTDLETIQQEIKTIWKPFSRRLRQRPQHLRI